MNITKFINSKDIAKHFKTAFHPEEYDDLSLRYAWLIWQSKNTTIKQKHEAYQEIIDTMPDCDLPKDVYDQRDWTLHIALKELIEVESTIMEHFESEKGNFKFTHNLTVSATDFRHAFHYYNRNFRSYYTCLNDVEREYRETKRVYQAYIEKKYENGKFIKVRLSNYASIISRISIETKGYPRFTKITKMFKNMWFKFPTPFKNGDIVCMAEKREKPYIFDEISDMPENFKRYDEGETDMTDNLYWLGQRTDMTAQLYWMGREGRLHCDKIDDYMDIEYYTEDSENEYDYIYQVIKKYLQGEVKMSTLLNSFLLNYLSFQTNRLISGDEYISPHEYYDSCSMWERE